MSASLDVSAPSPASRPDECNESIERVAHNHVAIVEAAIACFKFAKRDQIVDLVPHVPLGFPDAEDIGTLERRRVTRTPSSKSST